MSSLGAEQAGDIMGSTLCTKWLISDLSRVLSRVRVSVRQVLVVCEAGGAGRGGLARRTETLGLYWRRESVWLSP